MAERFSEIEKSSRRETSLEERLKEYPELKAKIETICARRLDRVGARVTDSASHIHATITSLFLRAGDIGGARDAVYHDSV